MFIDRKHFEVIECNEALGTVRRKAVRDTLGQAQTYANELMFDPARRRSFYVIKIRQNNQVIEEIRGTA